MVAANYLEKKVKTNAIYQMRIKWSDNPLHGQYTVRTKQTSVDKTSYQSVVALGRV